VRRRSFLAVAAALAACGPTELRAQCVDGGPAYDTRGQIVSIGADRTTLRIAHEEIPGYMRAMTMAFTACPSVDTTGLAAGDRIAFRFTRGEGGHFLVLSLQRLAPAPRPAG
jgi:Cu/Ag efflux protein CusF